MDPITGSIISGGAGIAGAVLTNQANSRMLDRQMDFQRDMSGTAHQREVNDLRAAGLNPMLSALGSGSAMAPGASMETQDPLAGISTGINTGMALRQQKKDLEIADKNLEVMEADRWNKYQQSQAAHSQAASTAQDVKLKVLEQNLLKQTMPSMIKKAKAEGDWSNVNQIMGVIKAGASSASDLLPSTRAIKGLGTLLKKGK